MKILDFGKGDSANRAADFKCSRGHPGEENEFLIDGSRW